MAKLLGGTTVYGLLSATGVMYASGGNSNQWNTAYSVVTAYPSTSSVFITNTAINSLTGNWNSAYASTSALNLAGYDSEIHVSQIDGNDTTGNGDLLNPVASITKALTLVGSGRKVVIIHPGVYTENPSITTQYTVLIGPGLVGGDILISGTVSTSTGCTIEGLKMSNLTSTAPTGAGNVSILNCDIGNLTQSGTADYTLIRFCDITSTNITGSAGLIAIFGGNPNSITINNAGARVIVKNAVTVAPVLSAGNANFVDSIVIAANATSNAITTAPGTIVNLANSQIIVPTFNSVARVSLSGFYSIFNCVYDKPNSTLAALSVSGGSTNSIDYFQYINADRLILASSGQITFPDGSTQTTAFLNNLSSYATNTLLQSTSALLTPLTTTNTLTSLLLPISIYQNASGSFATTTLLQSTSALLTPLTTTNTLTSLLLPISIYQNASSNWQSTYTTFNSNSGALTIVTSNSANWQTAYQSVSTTNLLNLSSIYWNNVYSTVYNTSGSWGGSSGGSSSISSVVSGVWQSTASTVSSLSANWSSVYTTFNANSASLTILSSNSANWNFSYNIATTYSKTSALYLPLSGGQLTGALTTTSTISALSGITGFTIATNSQFQFLTGGSFVKVYQFYNSTTNSLDTVFN